MKNKAENIYDNVVYEYKKMDDAPYRLDSSSLRSMQKMERALNFILNNLEVAELPSDEAAKQAGYEESYFLKAFRSYFGMPLQRFFTKLKLRRAAREIQEQNYPKQISVKYGFGSVQSFSKAFKREIGVSPREFFKGNYTVPDMPFRSRIAGIDIDMEYAEEHALSVDGTHIKAPDGIDTYLLDSYALPYSMQDQVSVEDNGCDKVGLWWYFTDEGMTYVYGDVTRRFDTAYVPEGEEEEGNILIQGGSYAVFSYRRPDDPSKISLMSRIMARYIFKEWVPMNAKVTNTIGFTYEMFTGDRVYIFLPLLSGMGGTDELKPRTWSIPAWTRYLDEHIHEPLTLESVATIIGYSPQNFRDIFTMYYDMTPTTYIKRRKLSLALNDLKAAGLDQNEIQIDKKSLSIIKAYGFSSYELFRDAFIEEFGKEPDINADPEEMPDIEAEYEMDNAKVLYNIRVIPDTYVLLHSIEEVDSEDIPADLIGRILYWFHRDFNDFSDIKDYTDQWNAKISIWGSNPDYEDGRSVYKYFVGNILDADLSQNDLTAIKKSTSASIEQVQGGKYAVFTTLDDTDNNNPEAAYHILTITAFGGWINENRWRTDLSRRTFVAWRNGKLYFYVPVVR